MFRLACSSHCYFLLSETPIATLWCPCAPRHVMWQRVFRDASEFKVRNLIWCTGHFAIYLLWLLCWRCISSLHRANEPRKEGGNCFIGSCHVGVSKRFPRSISLAFYNLSLYIVWLIRSLVDPTLATFIVCGPLQSLVLHFL